MINKNKLRKRLALTLALSQVFSVAGSLPIARTMGLGSTIVHAEARSPKTIHKWGKYNLKSEEKEETKEKIEEEYLKISDNIFGSMIYRMKEDKELINLFNLYFPGKLELIGFNTFIADYVDEYLLTHYREEYPNIVSYKTVYKSELGSGDVLVGINVKIKKLVTEKISRQVKGDKVGEVTSTSETTYPKNGEQDGYWYEYVGSEVEQTIADQFVPQTKTLEVNKNKTVKLEEGLTNKPSGAIVTVKNPVDTSSTGTKTGTITIKFSDNSSKDIDITVKVTSLEADDFQAEIKEIIARKGDNIDISKSITNIPDGASVKVTQGVDTSEAGKKTGKVEITFKDSSKKEVEIPVTIKDWTEIGTIKPVENIIDNIKEEVVEKGKTFDITDNIISENATNFEEVTDPKIDTNLPGQYVGKVKVTFKDGSSRVVNVPVIVLEDVSELNEKIKDLEKQLQDKIKELEEEKTNSTGDKEELQNRIKELEKQLKDLKESTDKTIAEKESEIKNLQEEIKSLNDKIKELEDKIKELENKIANLEKDKKDLEEDKKDLEDKIAELKEKLKDEKTSSEEDKYKIKELEDKITELEAKDIIKQDEIDRLEDEIKKLQDKLQDALYEKENLINDKNKLQDKIEELQKIIKDLTEGNKNKDSKIKELEKEIEDLKAKLSESQPKDDTKEKELEKQIKELQDKIKELEKDKKALEDDKKKAEEIDKKEDNKELIQKLKDLIHDGERKLKESDNLTRDSKRDLEDALDKAKEIVKEENPERQKIRDGIRDLEDAIKGLKTEEADKKELKDKLDEANKIDKNKLSDRDRKNLEDAIEKAKKVYDNEKASQKEVDEQVKNLKEILREIDRDYKDGARKNSSIKDMLSSTDKNLGDFIARVRKQLRKDLINTETISNDKEFNSLKYVFMINSPKYAEATNKDTLIYQMDTRPFIQNDRTMLPLRYVAYTLGADVNWNEHSRVATFTKNNITATIQIDTPNVINVNGKSMNMDSPVVIKDDRVFVSLTNISRIFNMTNGNTEDRSDNDIEWNRKDETVTIYIAR